MLPRGPSRLTHLHVFWALLIAALCLVPALALDYRNWLRDERVDGPFRAVHGEPERFATPIGADIPFLAVVSPRYVPSGQLPARLTSTSNGESRVQTLQGELRQVPLLGIRGIRREFAFTLPDGFRNDVSSSITVTYRLRMHRGLLDFLVLMTIVAGFLETVFLINRAWRRSRHIWPCWSGLAAHLIESSGRIDATCVSFTLIWPFVFLWPIVAKQVSIGNDFHYLYLWYKVYLIAFVAEGHFPLWSPTEAAGFGFFSNPFVAAIYPFNILYFLHYVLFGGLTSWDYSLYMILGVGLFGAGTYLWLRKLAIAPLVALSAALVTSVSLKVTEILRFPNAIQSAVWIPWLLLAISIATERKRLLRAFVIFAVSSFMLLTAGYPYYIVYTPFIVGPYLLCMMFDRTRNAFLGNQPEPPAGPFRLLFCITVAFALAGGLAFPWLIQVKDLMAETTDRATPNFSYATHGSSTLNDAIGSWIFPPASLMEGWYYCGMMATLLIAIYAVRLLIGHGAARDRHIVPLIFGWFALVTYFTWGEHSVLFTWVWHHVPVLNQMRMWARMDVILVPAMALLLALALSHYLEVLQNPDKRQAALTLGILGVLATAIALAQAYMIHEKAFSGYWEFYFKLGGAPPEVLGDYPPWSLLRRFDERYFVAMTLVAALALAGLLITYPRRAPRVRPAMAIVVGICAIDLFPLSSFQWTMPPLLEQRRTYSIINLLHDGFNHPRVFSSGTVNLSYPIQNVGLIPNWDFIRHARFYLKYFDYNGTPLPSMSMTELEAVKRLYGVDQRAERLFVSSRIDYSGPVAFIRDVDETATIAHPKISMTAYDGDTLKLTVYLDRAAWLSFIDNWDPGWRATVNGINVPIELLFGSYKSISLAPGSSSVVFAYRPWPFQSKM